MKSTLKNFDSEQTTQTRAKIIFPVACYLRVEILKQQT